MKVVVVGQAGCGKTCLVGALIGSPFDPQSPPSEQPTSVVLSLSDGSSLELVDCGLVANEVEFDSLLRSVDVVLLAFSCDDPISWSSIDAAWLEACRLSLSKEASIFLVGSKSDTLVDYSSLGEYERYAQKHGLPLFLVSAKTLGNIQPLFEALASRAAAERTPRPLGGDETPASARAPSSSKASAARALDQEPSADDSFARVRRAFDDGERRSGSSPTTMRIHRNGSVDISSSEGFAGIKLRMDPDGGVTISSPGPRSASKHSLAFSSATPQPVFEDEPAATPVRPKSVAKSGTPSRPRTRESTPHSARRDDSSSFLNSSRREEEEELGLEDEDVDPLLVDISLGGGVLGTMSVYPKDDPQVLVRAFIQSHGLDPRRVPELTRIVESRIEEYLKGGAATQRPLSTPASQPRRRRLEPREAEEEEEEEEELEEESRAMLRELRLGGSSASKLPAPPSVVVVPPPAVVSLKATDDAHRVVESFRREHGLSHGDPLLAALKEAVERSLLDGESPRLPRVPVHPAPQPPVAFTPLPEPSLSTSSYFAAPAPVQQPLSPHSVVEEFRKRHNLKFDDPLLMGMKETLAKRQTELVRAAAEDQVEADVAEREANALRLSPVKSSGKRLTHTQRALLMRTLGREDEDAEPPSAIYPPGAAQASFLHQPSMGTPSYMNQPPSQPSFASPVPQQATPAPTIVGRPTFTTYAPSAAAPPRSPPVAASPLPAPAESLVHDVFTPQPQQPQQQQQQPQSPVHAEPPPPPPTASAAPPPQPAPPPPPPSRFAKPMVASSTPASAHTRPPPSSSGGFSRAPMFYADVDTGVPGAPLERIPIYKDDDLDKVASDFVAVHRMPKTKKYKLHEQLAYQMKVQKNKQDLAAKRGFR